MSEFDIFHLLILPVGLGLLGFIEPCSIGSTLVFIKFLEGKNAATRIFQVAVFALTRALFIGALGVLAAVLGTAFFGVQKAAWLVLGALIAGIGLLFMIGRASAIMTTLGPSLSRLSGTQGSIGLGLLFGLNIPACALPLLAVLLGVAAAQGASGGTLVPAFVSLAFFGLALSLPLVIAVLFEQSRRALDWLAALSVRLPVWTGLLLVALGLWSIWFGLFARLEA